MTTQTSYSMGLLKAGLQKHLEKVSQIFNGESSTFALRIPMVRCPEFLAKLQDFLINEEGVASIAKQGDQSDFEHRLLLLSKNIDRELSQLPVTLRQWVVEQRVEVLRHTIKTDVSTFSFETAVAKLINDASVDPHINVETLQSAKIVELTSQQRQSASEIAHLLLSRSPTATSVFERRVVQDDDLFFEQKFIHLAGQSTCKIEFQEGSCKFALDLPQTFFRNLFQEERDRLVQGISLDQNIIDLFGDLVLDVRLAKDRQANVEVCLLSGKHSDAFVAANKLNLSARKSTTKSLMQTKTSSTESILSAPHQGQLTVVSGDIFQFLKEKMSTPNKTTQPSTLIISKILKDLSFLCSLIGIISGEISPREGAAVNVYFYLLVNEKAYTEKSVEELVINRLNTLAASLSNGKISGGLTLFEKSDLVAVRVISFDQASRKLLSIQLKVRESILTHQTQLLAEVKQKNEIFFHPTEGQEVQSTQSTTNRSQNLQEIEGVLLKKLKA